MLIHSSFEISDFGLQSLQLLGVRMVHVDRRLEWATLFLSGSDNKMN